MPPDAQDYHRHSIRRKGYDYSAAGAYFVTICAQGRSCLFGSVVNGRMQLNDAGRAIEAAWNALPERFANVELDAFIVMPNHVHGVLFIAYPLDRCPNGASPRFDLPAGGPAPVAHGTLPDSLGRILQAFKSITTHEYTEGVKRLGWKRFSGRVWQRDYFEHIIRNDWSLERIREYIATNPERWGADAENPVGTGTDDVKEWVQGLNQKLEGPDVGNELTSDGGRSNFGREGEHKVRPYGNPSVAGEGAGGRTQGSPLPLRIGHGYDLHRLQPGPRLVLGGVVVSEDVRPVAHSDGDVVLHALVDALLGAMGWGDIGEHFPNTDERWRDAPSRVFVSEIYNRVQAAGYQVQNADVTVLAERPKLKPFKSQIAASVAGMLGVRADRVNVKAGTNEGCDAIGRGEAIAAHAVVLLAASP